MGEVGEGRTTGSLCLASFVKGSMSACLLVGSAVVITVFLRTGLSSRGQAVGAATRTQRHPQPVSMMFRPEQSWQYWEVCGNIGEPCTQPLRYGSGLELSGDDERFLLLETRGCGFNNERHSVEQAFALAYVWKRTLVLPPYMGPPIYPTELYVPGEAYDLTAMNQSIKVMAAEDFVALVKARPERFGGEAAAAQLGINPKAFGKMLSWEAFPGWFRGAEWIANGIFLHMNFTGRIGLTGTADLADTPEFKAFATPSRPHTPMALSQDDWEAPVLRLFPRAMLGNYYAKVFIPGAAKRAEVRHAMRQTLRLRREYFEAAAAAMAAAGLAPGAYGAIHNRQGDWAQAHWSMYLEPDLPGKFTEQLENRQFLMRHQTIYVASNPTQAQADLMDRVWYPAIKALMPEPRKIVTLSDPAVYQAAAAHVGQFQGWQGIVEMIICSRADEFLGTWGSTFSSYIHRLRGYMPDVVDKRILFYERDMVRKLDGTWPSWSAAAAAGEIEMAVEWQEGFSDVEASPSGGNPLAMFFR